MTYAPRSRRGATRSGRVCRRNAILPKPTASADHRARSAADAGAAGDGGYSSGSGVYVMRIPHENDSEEEQLLSSDVGPFEILQARQLLESNIAAFAAKMANSRRYRQSGSGLSSRSSGLSPSTTPRRITPARSIWCWPWGDAESGCCWRRWSGSGCRWTAARCGNSSMCILPAAPGG